jgi:1-aminocyclopropane-1-carboxylate deaminase/D-cysteine desulfhydrase-like pyridoxal-dependent ACC family enzyme
MQICLVKVGPHDDYDPNEYDGNHLLHFMAGADIKVTTMEKVETTAMQVMDDLRQKGHRPYYLAAAGSTPLGVVGYLICMLELTSQLVDLGLKADYLVHATGSGGTQAGLVIGAKLFNNGIKVLGSTTGSRSREEAGQNVTAIIQDSLRDLELKVNIDADDINIYDQYGGAGYGFLTKEKLKALKIAAETECLFLDPVYTGSAMACLIDLCDQGFFSPNDVVIFLHTGGVGGLFPYKAPIKSYLQGQGLDWTIPPWSPDGVK